MKILIEANTSQDSSVKVSPRCGPCSHLGGCTNISAS